MAATPSTVPVTLIIPPASEAFTTLSVVMSLSVMMAFELVLVGVCVAELELFC